MTPTALFLTAFLCTAAPAPGADASGHHPRVVVIGLDGASLNMIGPLAQAGAIPNTAALISGGASGDLASIWPLRTPQVWTTLATGKYPGQHGIWDHYTNTKYNPPPMRTKDKQRFTSKQRRAKALWNIADEAGLKTLTVGWIASWPAEKLDHGIMAAPIVRMNPAKQVSIKGSFWRDANQQVYPKSKWATVKPLIVERDDLSAEDVREFADLPAANSPLYRLPNMTRYVGALKWSVARARTVEAISLGLLKEADPDVLMLYFQCSDSLLHRFWIFKESEEEIRARLSHHKISPAHVSELTRRFGRVVEACYRDLDARIGRILAAARGPETLVVLVSDHGFGPAPVPHPDPKEPYGGNHRDDGVIIAAGPGIAAGRKISGASVLDIAPSLLYHLGQPVADDMRGRLIPELFAEDALVRRPLQRVPSYEKKPQLKIPFIQGWPSRSERPLAADR